MNELITLQSLPCFRKLSANLCGLALGAFPWRFRHLGRTRPYPRCPGANEATAPAYSTANRLYFPNAEYPRGFVGGKALKLHFFFPHFEHRIRFSTSTRRASQPHNRASVCGSAVRSWLHAEHVKTKVYSPNSSLILSIRNSRAIGAYCYEPK